MEDVSHADVKMSLQFHDGSIFNSEISNYTRNTCKSSVVKHGKTTWKTLHVGVKILLNGPYIERQDMEWIYLAHNMVKWQTRVNMVLYVGVPYNPRDFLTSRAISRLPGRTLVR
jgi:hypothetical protein